MIEDATYKHVDAETPCQAMTRCLERESQPKWNTAIPWRMWGIGSGIPENTQIGECLVERLCMQSSPHKPKEPRGQWTKQTSPAYQFKVF